MNGQEQFTPGLRHDGGTGSNQQMSSSQVDAIQQQGPDLAAVEPVQGPVAQFKAPQHQQPKDVYKNPYDDLDVRHPSHNRQTDNNRQTKGYASAVHQSSQDEAVSGLRQSRASLSDTNAPKDDKNESPIINTTQDSASFTLISPTEDRSSLQVSSKDGVTNSMNALSMAAPAPQALQADDSAKALPYTSSVLKWNKQHTLNDQARYCYCGEDRNLLDLDVQCKSCQNHFHGRCIKLNLGSVVPFMTNYDFRCRNCGLNSQENFNKLKASWPSICASTLANLILMHMRSRHPDWDKAQYAASRKDVLSLDHTYHTRKNDMLPFLQIDRHWTALCTGLEDNKDMSTSANEIGACLVACKDVFKTQDENNRSINAKYTLKDPDLFQFRANYLKNTLTAAPRKRKAAEINSINGRGTSSDKTMTDTMKRKDQETLQVPPERASQRDRASDAPAFSAKIPTVRKEPARPANVAPKDQTRERKPTAKKAATGKKADISPTKLIRRPPPYKPQDFDAMPKAPGMTQVEGSFEGGPYYSITDIPYNKRGFKYTMCEAAPAMPAIMYRQVEVAPHRARFDWSDMSPYLYLTKDGNSATTDKGFRMGRANVGVREGQWYWEVKVLRGNGDQGGHVRLGVARREASLDGPIGFDGYSYGIRDKGGEKMHLSRPRPFMESFGTGDVIGFHLTLPKSPQIEVVRDRIPIRYRQQLYFEQYEYTTSKEMEDLLNPGTIPAKSQFPPTLRHSSLKVYKNGKSMGMAFDNLLSFWPPNSQTTRDQPAKDDGLLGYYPAVSVYSGGAAQVNFGPDFECPPERNLLRSGTVRSMSERYDEQIAEDVVYDLLDEVEFEQELNGLSLGQDQLEVEPMREIAEYD